MGAPNNAALNRYFNSQFMNLVMRHCRYPCLYTLHFTLYTKSDSNYAVTLYTLRFTLLAPTPLSLASNLSPYRLIAHCLPKAVF